MRHSVQSKAFGGADARDASPKVTKRAVLGISHSALPSMGAADSRPLAGSYSLAGFSRGKYTGVSTGCWRVLWLKKDRNHALALPRDYRQD